MRTSEGRFAHPLWDAISHCRATSGTSLTPKPIKFEPSVRLSICLPRIRTRPLTAGFAIQRIFEDAQPFWYWDWLYLRAPPLHLAHQRIDRPGSNRRSTTELGRKVMCSLLRTDRARCACRQRRKIKRAKRDELAETNTVNLPGVAAVGRDIRTRWPDPPTLWHVGEDGVRLEKVQLRVEIAALNPLDGRTTPIVVRCVEEQLTAAVNPAASDPHWTWVAGVGGPGNLVRMAAADDLA